MPRRKMTPFARFFIVMLIIVPLAYFGASWYNGDDPLGLKEKLNIAQQQKVEQVTVKADEVTVESLQARIQKLEQELEKCKQDLKDLHSQNK